MKIVDCIGDVCPMPVIKTKKAIAAADFGPMEIRVDNGISLENVKRYVGSLGYDAVSVTRDGYFAIIVEASGQAKSTSTDFSSIAVISSDVMGHGDDELGRKLMHSFIFALTQLDSLPHTVVLYNRGVLLAIEDSFVLGDLHALADLGVQILSCGLCIDHFNCGAKLAVGGVTNMYTIVEMMKNGNVIRP